MEEREEEVVALALQPGTGVGVHFHRVPETIPAGVEGREEIAASIEKSSMLGRAATLEDVGNVAAFVASDRARTMTAATANISCGALID